jgi:hypothetical protein
VGFLERGRPGPVATGARNVRLSGCTYAFFSQFREDLRPNSLKVGCVKTFAQSSAGAEMADTWDEEEDNEQSLMGDWATAERIAATILSSATLLSTPTPTPTLRPKMLPENPSRSTFSRDNSYSNPSTN